MSRLQIPALCLASFLLVPSMAIADAGASGSFRDGIAQNGIMALPFPPAADPGHGEMFLDAIKEARETDVSVTPHAALMYKGLTLSQEEEFGEAVPYLEEALRRDPSLRPAWEGLGWAYVKTGRIAEAVALWNYFRLLNPKESLPYTLLAQGALLRQRWEEADGYFSESLKIDPEQYDVRFWHAQNLLRLGRTAKAKKIFRDLLKEDPDRLDIELNLASTLSQDMEYDEAVELYRHVNSVLPGNAKFMLEQALLELRTGNLHDADRICLEVLDSDPDNKEAMRLRADIAEIDGQNDTGALEAILEETSARDERAAICFRLANRCHQANLRSPGSYKEDYILSLMKQGTEESPDNIEYSLLYAERLLEAGKAKEASSIAKDVLERKNRNNTRAKMILFETALREGRPDDAAQIIRDRFSGFDGTNPYMHYYRARILLSGGEYREALKELETMERLSNRGAVYTLLYKDLTLSDWSKHTSQRRLHEHISALQREGWELVSAADIPKYIAPDGNRYSAIGTKQDIPATARLFDYLRWCFSGERKFRGKRGDEETEKPKKYFAVTFDGALRSSLKLGSEVAAEFGVPFAMFVPTLPPAEYTPERAGWEEISEAAASGNWVVGSSLSSSDSKKAVDPEGNDLRAPIPNRLWLEDKNRSESMNEWDRRMRFEFRESKRRIRKELKENSPPLFMVAYPFGDVGQQGGCNISAIKNPMRSILSEAERSYSLGFVQSFDGYTVYGDDPMLSRRFEPQWSFEGGDIVRHAYENHPSFIARKMRCEIAIMMNRPSLAQSTLDALKRDGYPADLCEKIEETMHVHFRNAPRRNIRPLMSDKSQDANLRNASGDPDLAKRGETGSFAIAEARAKEQQGNDDPLFRPQKPFLAFEISSSKAVDQIDSTRYGARGGFDINNNTSFEIRYNNFILKQTVRPRWNAQVTTNVPYAQSKYKFRMEGDEIRLGLTHRLGSGTILSASVGLASKSQNTDIREQSYYSNLQDELNKHVFTLDDDESATLIRLGVVTYPANNLGLRFYYDRDYVSSAVKNIVYESVGTAMTWKPEDSWTITAGGRYWSYDDSNAMFHANAQSLWEIGSNSGVWGGIRYSTTTASNPCDFYWTPYWDRKIMGVLRYEKMHEGYALGVDIMAGMQGESGRADRAYEQPVTKEREVLVDGVANTVRETTTEFVIAEDANTGWHRSWGVSARLERQLSGSVSLALEGEMAANREFLDHFVTGYLKVSF